MEIICQPCAAKMRKNNIAKVKLSVVAAVIEKQKESKKAKIGEKS